MSTTVNCRDTTDACVAVHAHYPTETILMREVCLPATPSPTNPCGRPFRMWHFFNSSALEVAYYSDDMQRLTFCDPPRAWADEFLDRTKVVRELPPQCATS